jgi:hypothetical protein
MSIRRPVKMDPTTLSRQEEDHILALADRIKRVREAVEVGTSKSVEWRKLPLTEKQTKILKENGYATDKITRGIASDIIDKIFKESRKT